MAKKIIGNRDGKNGSNDSYRIHGRGDVARVTVVKEIEEGEHPNYIVTKINGKKYVKAKPDNKKTNNVN